MSKPTYGLTGEEYASYRRPFTPARPKIIFICESPPISKKYFYNPKGLTSEPLFTAMMRDVLGIEAKTKLEGLTAFGRHLCTGECSRIGQCAQPSGCRADSERSS